VVLGLIALPLRIGREVAEMTVRLGLEAARVAAGAVLPDRDGDVVVVVPERPGEGAPPAGMAGEPDDFLDEPVEVPTPDLGPAQQPAPEPVEVPVHVSEELELVEESAEAGAEDGAGAQVEVEEPWAGYDSMRVPEIERELEGADPAVAAAVKLYETSGRGRRGVLSAADRRLRA
jgi:hypothetical protein